MLDLILFVGMIVGFICVIKFLMYMGNEFIKFCAEITHDIKYAWSKTYKENYDKKQEEEKKRIEDMLNSEEETRKRLGYGSYMFGGPDYC